MFRTNCLDCLDRTNVTQAYISFGLLDHILKQILNNIQKTEPNARFFDQEAKQQDLRDALKRMWNENGDKLSEQYTGTNSNISGVLEEGRQGFAGKFNQLMTGVKRYVVSNISDPDK